MSITDELRDYTKRFLSQWCWDKYKLTEIADRIDAEHERGMSDAELSAAPTEAQLSELGYVELPKDADGEPIHVGDVMEWLDEPGVTRTVTSIQLSEDGWWVYINGTGRRPDKYRHYHAPTVEDVLTEMVAKIIERGELTNGAAQTIAEYAKRLTLAEGEDA
jgi:hypothetical protein